MSASTRHVALTRIELNSWHSLQPARPSLRRGFRTVHPVAAEVPAFDSVLTMLDNLVKQIDEEAQNDDADYKSYMTWFTAEHSKARGAAGKRRLAWLIRRDRMQGLRFFLYFHGGL